MQGHSIPGPLAFRPVRIPTIIVEQNPAATLSLISHFKEEFSISLARDANAAWGILANDELPKLFLLDREMADLDPIAFCRKLRQARRDYYSYLLIMTSLQQKDQLSLALQAGADEYLIKPFAEVEFRAHLEVAIRILQLQDQLLRSREESWLMGMTDTLTGLWTRGAFLKLYEREIARATRSNSTTGLMFIDIDHFKKINDSHGHLAGDLFLKEFSRRLCAFLRPYDCVARFGGDEFCVTLPDSNREHLSARAEMLRQAIAHESIRVGDADIPVTVSIGATTIPPSSEEAMAFRLAIADLALYKAKASGRDRTVYCDKVWNSIPTGEPNRICKQCELPVGSCIVTPEATRSVHRAE